MCVKVSKIVRRAKMKRVRSKPKPKKKKIKPTEMKVK